MNRIIPRFLPELDPEFIPAALWNRAYRTLVAEDKSARPLILGLVRADGTASLHSDRILGRNHPAAVQTVRYVERLLKFLLWQKGGSRVLVAGADDIAAELGQIYRTGGTRAFDFDFMGQTIDRRPFAVEAVEVGALPVEQLQAQAIGRHLDGCRIGFDLGGSDRKAAALIDGKVVYSEEIPWDPYFQADPQYHIDGVDDSLRRAAAHLPRVDAIGGSAAGVYVNNEVRVASLFRGVSPELFERHIRRMFFTLQERWGGVPFEVVNDGEVTALAGSMAFDTTGVLGIAMGTSQAAGYVRPTGDLTPWLNELAFAPIDYRVDAPRDEWSGDLGCGAQYFSQQGVARLAVPAGFGFPQDMPLAERLVQVQRALAAGDDRARRIYSTIGTCLGYAVAHYSDFYDLSLVLVLGRVSSGAGGELILERAAEVLRGEFPGLAERIRLQMPDEHSKRHGQAVAAASLPALR